MKKENFLIGIDVYQSRYYSCFYNIGSKKCKYYTGSLINEFGKNRLINRINRDDLIIINESLLAAKLIIKFADQVTIINNDIISLLCKANVSRGNKMAEFFIKNFKDKKNEQFSKVMLKNLLNEFEKNISQQEKLCDEGVKTFDHIMDDEMFDYETILDLEDQSRAFINLRETSNNKVEEVEKVIKRYDKLKDVFDD